MLLSDKSNSFSKIEIAYLFPVGTRRRFNVEAWLKFRRDVVSMLIDDGISTLFQR